MKGTADVRTAFVYDALVASTVSIEAVGASSWALAAAGEPSVALHAFLDGDWLRFETGSAAGDTGLDALERNRRLDGLAKLALEPAGAASALHARAELPIHAADPLVGRVQATLRGLHEAGAGGSTPSERAAPCVEADAAAEEAAAPRSKAELSLAEICATAGWSSKVQRPDRLAVDLGLRDVFTRAWVDTSPASDEVRISAVVASLPPPSEGSRSALAVFLLRASSLFRMVRPIVELADDVLSVGFEARFATAPSPHEIGAALAALHVAGRRTSREVAALGGDEILAEAYLSRSAGRHAATSAGAEHRAESTIDAAFAVNP